MMYGLPGMLLNMSVTAGAVALIVLVLRLLLRRLPKGCSYALWFIVLFRFLCPVTIPSPLSLLPAQPDPVLTDVMYAGIPVLQDMMITRRPAPEMSVFGVEPTAASVAEDRQAAIESIATVGKVLGILMAVWLTGMLLLLCYGLFSFLRLKRRLATAIRTEQGIYESDQLAGAFVIGMFRPVIYLPAGLEDEDRKYIICHERAHIVRRDYLVKLAGLLMVTIHWFNPLAWVSFHYLCRDMEMACDERVLKTLGMTEKKAYSQAILHSAEQGGGLLILAFGESSAKLRIKNVLKYRKPRLWVSLVAVVLLLGAGIGLATNPESSVSILAFGIVSGADGPTSTFGAIKMNDKKESDEAPWKTSSEQMPDEEWLMNTGFQVAFPGEEHDNGISLDIASENSVMFHGAFGFYSFACEDGRWQPKLYIPGEEAQEVAASFASRDVVKHIWSKDSIHPKERLILSGQSSDFTGAQLNEGWQDFDAGKMANGKIAVLGGYTREGTAQLIDLFYGYYDPRDQIFHQVYLFLDDGVMTENPKGEIKRLRYDSDGFYAEETPPGELTEDAKAIQQIAEQIIAAYWSGDMDTILAYAVDGSSINIELSHGAENSDEIPRHLIHGLYAIRTPQVNDDRKVWCSFREPDNQAASVEQLPGLEIALVKTEEGWKVSSLELSK